MTREEAINEIKSWAISSKKGREVLETLIPELAESEDERIRKALVEYFAPPVSFTAVRGISVQKVRDWLEKKEEQKPLTDEEKEYIRTIKNIISDFIRDKKPENLAYYQRIYDWLDGRHVPFSCGQENGKQADPVFSKQEYESHPIISKDTTSVKPRELDGKTLLYTADKSYQIGFRDGVASVKPAEWSEGDEKVLCEIIQNINAYDAYTGTTYKQIEQHNKKIKWLESIRSKQNAGWSENDEQMFNVLRSMIHGTFVVKTQEFLDELLSWLKSLKGRIQPQLKQEWSEEDEHRRDGVIQWLREYQKKFNPKYDSLSIESIDSLIDWLKSLRPQSKKELSIEKAIQWLDDTFYFLDNSSGRGRDCEITTNDFDSLEEMYDSFRKAVTVDAQPSWKPSKEQMKALYSALNDAISLYSNKVSPLYEEISRTHFDALESLYNDLKKLM